MEKAFHSQLKLPNDPLALSSTHLNTCALYSEIGKHEQALNQAEFALSLISKAESEHESCFENPALVKKETESLFLAKVIALYNAAV